jgi:hypothetical protein
VREANSDDEEEEVSSIPPDTFPGTADILKVAGEAEEVEEEMLREEVLGGG